MKKAEKILLSIVLLLFLLLFIPAFSAKVYVFYIGVIALSVTYLTASYWLFNTGNRRNRVLPLLAGLCFAAALLSVPYNIWVWQQLLFDLLPVPNLLLCVSLAAYFLWHRQSWVQKADLRNLFVRSLCIGLLSAFFAYMPFGYSRAYRSLLALFNRGEITLLANIDMHNYGDDFDRELKAGNCAKALQYAKDANLAARIWVGLSVTENLEQEASLADLDPNENMVNMFLKLAMEQEGISQRRSRIASSYIDLWKAYDCVAKDLYEAGEYSQALSLYTKAEAIPKLINLPADERAKMEFYTMHKKGLCCAKLGQHHKAVAMLENALGLYIAAKIGMDENALPVLRNLAQFYKRVNAYEYSISANLLALKITGDNPETDKKRTEYVKNSHALALSWLRRENTAKAWYYMEQAGRFVLTNTSDYGNHMLLNGLLCMNMDRYAIAGKFFEAAGASFLALPGNNRQELALTAAGLANATLQQGNYTKTAETLSKSIPFTAEACGSTTPEYAGLLKIRVLLNLELAEYQAAAADVEEVIAICENHKEQDAEMLAEAIMLRAEVQLALSDIAGAQQSTKECLQLLGLDNALHISGAPGLQNIIAAVYFSSGEINKATALCGAVLEQEQQYGRVGSATAVKAWNILGRIAIAINRLQEADLYLDSALFGAKELYTEKHPYVAVIYCSQALLRLSQKRPEDAESLLQKALDINRIFLPEEHDAFADIYKMLAEVKRAQGNDAEALSYDAEAHKIYLAKFGPAYGGN